MYQRILGVFAWFLALGLASSASPTDNRQTRDQRVTFQPGQSVYIAAYSTTGQADLTIERRVKEAFLKQKVFKVADKISEADFVFVVYAEYTVVPDRLEPGTHRSSKTKRQTPDIWSGRKRAEEMVQTAEGFALLPEQYSRHKGDRDALRDVAYWHQQASSTFLTIPERHSGQLVKKFHEAVTGGRKTSARQADNQPPRNQPFTFSPGQLVYIAAYETNGNTDLTLERRVKEAFMKQKVFTIADKISEADFVFLVYAEYTVIPDSLRRAVGDQDQTPKEVMKSAEGFALAPEQYTRHKRNRDALRDAAYWRQQTSSKFPVVPDKHSGQLVKKFHEAVTKGRKTSP